MEMIKTIFETGVLILLVFLMLKDHQIIKETTSKMEKALK